MKKTTKKLKKHPKKKTLKKANKKTKRKLFFHLGNLFMLLSAVTLFVVFYPVVATYIFPKPIIASSELKGDYITIPKIKAQAPLFFDVDPWDKDVYMKVLKKGVAQAKDTPLPGEAGRSFIFAHSSGNPFENTRYNTVFLRLGELDIGDIIEIKRDGEVYKYSVTQKKVVTPTETEYLMDSGSDGIIVQTCWPIGTSYKRLLIFAAPIN